MWTNLPLLNAQSYFGLNLFSSILQRFFMCKVRIWINRNRCSFIPLTQSVWLPVHINYVLQKLVTLFTHSLIDQRLLQSVLWRCKACKILSRSFCIRWRELSLLTDSSGSDQTSRCLGCMRFRMYVDLTKFTHFPYAAFLEDTKISLRRCHQNSDCLLDESTNMQV